MVQYGRDQHSMPTSSSQQRRNFKEWHIHWSRSLHSRFTKSHSSTLCGWWRNATMVDAHGIMVKNAMLINGDYHRMHASIQSLTIDMFKKTQDMGYSRTAKHVSWPCPNRDSQRILWPTFDQRIYHSRHNDLRPSTSRKVWTGDTTKDEFTRWKRCE